VKWLQQYKDIEGVIAHAAELTPERFREAVRDRANDLRRNLKLTTLNLTLPTVAAEKPRNDAGALFALLEGFEMKGSLNEARTRYGQPEFLF
jgi:DNA polymerase I